MPSDVIRSWISVFWSPSTEPLTSPPDQPAHGEPLGGPLLMVVPTAALAAATLAIGLAAGPLYDLSARAAADLLDPTAYLTAVAG